MLSARYGHWFKGSDEPWLEMGCVFRVKRHQKLLLFRGVCVSLDQKGYREQFWYNGKKSTGGMTESLNARVSWRAVTNFIRSCACLPREHHLLPLPDQASLSWTFLRLFREEHPSRIDLDPQKSLSRPRTGLILVSVCYPHHGCYSTGFWVFKQL